MVYSWYTVDPVNHVQGFCFAWSVAVISFVLFSCVFTGLPISFTGTGITVRLYKGDWHLKGQCSENHRFPCIVSNLARLSISLMHNENPQNVHIVTKLLNVTPWPFQLWHDNFFEICNSFYIKHLVISIFWIWSKCCRQIWNVFHFFWTVFL